MIKCKHGVRVWNSVRVNLPCTKFVRVNTLHTRDRKRPIPLICHLLSPMKAPGGDSKEAITNRNKFRQVSRMHARTYIVDFSCIT